MEWNGMREEKERAEEENAIGMSRVLEPHI